MEQLNTKACSLKQEGKPNLFSFDLRREFEHIEGWVYDNKRYSRRNLEKEEKTLKQLAIDFMNIIRQKNLNHEQLDRLEDAVINGASGVWETATTKLELLAFHFDLAKDKIKKMIKSSNAKGIVRSLTMLSDAFTLKEQTEIFIESINHKSKNVRCWAANQMINMCNSNDISYHQKVSEYTKILELKMDTEENQEVLDSFAFVIKHISRISQNKYK